MALLCLNFKTNAQTTPIKLSGIISDNTGKPIPGATIKIAEKEKVSFSDKEGKFSFTTDSPNGTLTISNVGYQTINITYGPKSFFEIILKETAGSLDDVVVIAYGTTTKRLNTGSTAKISSEEISKQPVSNPLEVLYGRVPGLVVTSTGGLPGAAVKVQLRGRTSINSAISNDPLFIIDGIPYATNNNDIGLTGRNAAGSVSPFNSISPDDIERIDVLKDADATSIYGSRGSNGVILIQTKKGIAGKTKVNANVNYGWSTVTNSSEWMHTTEYLQMRKEGFKNDGVVMTNANAYDVLVWDTTRYTDFKKLVSNNVAKNANANLSISGGDVQTQFLIAGAYNHQGTLIPGNYANNRGSALINLNHMTKNQKFNIQFSSNYVNTKNDQTANDLSNYLNLPPNLPELYTADGKLNWISGGFSFVNPLAYLKRTYVGTTKNLIANLQSSYTFTQALKFKTSVGYNLLLSDEKSQTPIASQDPATNPTGTSVFANGSYNALIIEPQLNYNKMIGELSVNALIGGSWQSNINTTNSIVSTGYTNDLLLGTHTAGNPALSYTANEYKYAAIFGRINLNLKNKYLLNFTGRRDGSSRFGLNKRFSNFGSVGGAYIFSEEPFIKSHLPFLSFGKLRGSYGITGNDKIGDYGYLNSYSAKSTSFQGVFGLIPTGLPNADYGWEINRKLELALELHFLKDRISFNTGYYNNKSSNQLLSYALPSQTGGTSIVANFPAKVENSGLEFELAISNIASGTFKWNSSINLSIPKNKLLAFPNLSTSSYGYLIIGQPLSVLYGLSYSGINSQTGLPQFVKSDGSLSNTPVYATDKNPNLGNLDPKFYGGFSNDVSYKAWNFSFLFEFRKQTGTSVIGNIFSNATYPGTMFNQPLIALERWRASGDATDLPRYTAVPSSAGNNISTLQTYNSTFRLTDASYIRLKNIALSYQVPEKLIRKIALERLRLYANAQNFFVLSHYQYTDPETQSLLKTGPLRSLSIGLQTTF